MKQIIYLMIAMLMFSIVFAAGSFTTDATETYSKDFIVVTVAGEIDSTETMTSSVFNLSNYRSYGQAMIEFPIIAGFEFTKDAVGDTLNITATIYGSLDNVNYVVCDTIGTITTETYTTAEIDFNNRIYQSYKVKLVGGTNNHNDVDFDIKLVGFAPKIK